jgi:hypothetical protein
MSVMHARAHPTDRIRFATKGFSMSIHRYRYPALVAAALLTAACASAPRPDSNLAATRAAVEAAELAGAAQSAPVELSAAREKLTYAQIAANDDDMDKARRLADEALADAQLAQAKAATAHSREGVAQAENALQALRDEVNRATPAAPDGTTVTPVPPR